MIVRVEHPFNNTLYFTTIKPNDRKTDNRIPLLPIDAAQHACAAYYQHAVCFGIAGG
jgi:hypothetical protein